MRNRNIIIVVVLTIFAMISTASALEKKSIDKVNIDAVIKDTQVSATTNGSHMNLIWWIPCEFWQAILANDKTTSEPDKEKTMKVFKPYSLLAVCQADISDFGAFRFYSKEQIQESLEITFRDTDGKDCKLVPLKEVDPDLEVLLGMFKPIFTAAAGNMGQNFHFFVLKDYDSSGMRIIDPYRFGAIRFHLGRQNGEKIGANIDLPLNSLYVPRLCPNGKEALM
jgi:hypothetical protein